MSEFAGFEGIAASPVAHELTLRLTFALLHFLWQGALIALFASGVAWSLRNGPARRRYGLHVAALVALILCVPVTFAIVRIPVVPVAPSSDSVHVASNNVPAEVPPARPFGPDFANGITTHSQPLTKTTELAIASTPAVTDDTAAAEQPSTFPMAAAWSITAVYGLGVCLMLLRLTAALWGGQRLRAVCTVVTDAQVLELISHQARSVGLKSAPAVAWCERTAVPMVVGILRPLVLLPASLATGLDSSQLAAIISHELAHIRRFDLLVNLFQRIVESLLFFHPAVWWISRRVSSERELSCDDLVIQSGCERTQYVDALIHVAELCTASRPSLLPQVAALRASGQSRSDLSRRVYRLLGATDTPKVGRVRSTSLLGLAAVVAMIAVVVFQYESRSAAPLNNGESNPVGTSRETDRDSSMDAVEHPSSATDNTEKGTAHRSVPVYQLREDQVLKWIPPEQTDQRPDNPEAGAGGYYYEQDGTTVRLKIRDFGGEPPVLFSVVHSLLRVPWCDLTGDASVWTTTRISGDFVVRKDASPESLLKALDHSLREDMDLQASLRWVHRESDAWVVSGEFDPAPIGEAWRLPKERAYVFYGLTGPGDNRHGTSSAGSFDDLLKAFGSRTGLPVANELKETPPGYFGWQTFYDEPERTVWNDFPRQHAKNVDLVVQHFQEQTGLQVRKERRRVRLLKAATEVAPEDDSPEASSEEQKSEKRKPDDDSHTTNAMTGTKENAEDESNDRDDSSEKERERADRNVETATITGTVVDTDDTPVAGVRVSTQWYQGQDEALTDDAGQFQLQVPRERILGRTVHASAESGRLQAQHQIPWEIDQSENLAGIRLQLHPAQRVELHVVDTEGKPVTGAKAGLIANYVNFDHGATDDSGQIVFLLPHDLTVTNVYAFADHKGMDYRAYVLPRGRDQDQNAEPPQLPQESIRLTLDGAKPLTVRVQEPDQSPIVGISLSPWLVKKPDQPEDLNVGFLSRLVEEQTDATGTAVFNWIPLWNERSIEVWPQDEEHVRQRGSCDPKAGDGTLLMTLDRLVPIGGRVTMPDGSPTAGITISAKGEGHQFDGFQGSATTDADGRYEIKAAPNMVYLLTASGDGLAAAPQTDFAVWPDQSLDDLDFQLRPATRLFGRVTMGDERKPVEGQRIYSYQYGSGDHELKDINLPNPEGSRTSTRPYIVHQTKTDADGRFELLVGSGKFDIRGPSQNEIEKFEITDETEREFNFHAARPERGLLTGEVVLAETGEPVEEAEVYGIYRYALAGLDMQATTDKSGRFKVDRELHRTVIHARSKDTTQAGVIEIGADDETVTIPIHPVASAHGRLIDQATGEPMPGEEIRYGVNVHLGNDDAPFRTSFGGTATTDDEGRFRLKNLIRGQNYSLDVTVSRDQNQRATEWRHIGNVVPEEARDIDLGDMELKPAYRSPTIRERVASAFSSKKTPVERFEASRSDAGLSHQHVLILFGNPDGNAVKQFMELRYGDSDVRRTFDPFQFLAVDSSAGKLSAARELANQLDLWLGDGREVFSVVITDAKGQPLANADAGKLMHGGKISLDKVTAFLAEHAPEILDARTLLNNALARAKAENKRVIVQETATWCGPCWLLSRFLKQHQDKWEGDYILVKMDHRWTGSRELMEKLRDGAEGGIPWWTILNADGDILVTSNNSDGDNIGFPSDADGRAHFRTMLQKTALRMTDDQIAKLVDALADDE